ncbi:hypothetical protein [Brevundimonas sp. SL130]|uniref:hypothetical protein n=1 Tax=Brevundimonas sp. SL130 TaxID=2995143 RepID=UPI00226CB626|nr:hypothetical protein [Brevundimonas sp. SL130]WAC59406.1 hypothetical protein OU998_14480 [Brevundimonas sp. SL130]
MIIFVVAIALYSQAASLPLPATSSAPSAQPTAPRVVEVATADTNGSEAEERRAGRRLICRNEPVVGSRFPVRRCRPADLTPEERALAADQLRRQQSQNMRADGSQL